MPPCLEWRATHGVLAADDVWLVSTILAAGATRDMALSTQLSKRSVVPLAVVAAHLQRNGGPPPPVAGCVFSNNVPTMLKTGLGVHIGGEC